MPTPLASTKFFIPKPRPSGVLRPRLTQRLLDGLQHPGTVLLLSCPPGFGKTTLLAEFVLAYARPVAWLSLDDADNDPICFWTAMLAALQRVRPGTGEVVSGLLEMPASLPNEVIPSLLINDLVGLDESLVLVLDDYHLIHEQAIHSALAFLLDRLPEKFHIVISTRTDPPWPLARFRARDRLIELRAADLRFTRQEVLAFLNVTMGLGLSAEDAAALEARTEGWAASLQLAAVSMQGKPDIPAFIRDFAGSHTYVAGYLLEEVLQNQPETLQAFLLRTSILERFNSSLCQAVTGDGQAAFLITSLEQKNLFLIPLDEQGTWYRYHHLFADLLQAQLSRTVPAEEIVDLHRRAAVWYRQHEMLDEALAHLLAARDYRQALELVEEIALPMILQAYIRTVDGWLHSIPAQLVAASPRANMAFAWMHILRGDLSHAIPYLARLEIMLPQGEADASLQGEWLALQSRQLVAQGEPHQARTLAERALALLPGQDVHVRCMLYVNLAMACQQMLDYDQAAEAFGMIVKDATQTGNFVLETLGTSGRAQMLLQMGKLHLAAEAAADGVQRMESSGRMTPFGATLYGELGQIYYYWNRLDEARSYSLRSIQLSGTSGYSDPEIFHHIFLSRVFQLGADWSGAARELQPAVELAQAMPPAMVREELISQQVVVGLSSGRIGEAQALLELEGFSFDHGFRFPDLPADSTVTHPLGLLYNSAFRVLLARSVAEHAQEDLERGVQLAGTVLAGELRCRHIPIAIQTLLLRSQMFSALAREADARHDLIQALELGQPEGFVSIFLEEGPQVAASLRGLLASRSLDSSRSAYVEDLLAAFPQAGPHRTASHGAVQGSLAVDVPIESLTSRELDVLQLIAEGHSNRAIAARLVITLSAVKKHTGNIFRKLGVHSRTQALVRARQLALLRPGR